MTLWRAKVWAVGLVTSCALAGCQHYSTRIPGVLDLRDDVSVTATALAPAPPLPPSSPPHLPPSVARSGLAALVQGAGVSGGVDVTVEERAFWLLGLWALHDGNASSDLESVLATHALTHITLTQQSTWLDVALTTCVGPVCLPLSLVMPPATFTLHGTRAAAVTTSAPVTP
jgi:hypothetical protein